MNRADKIGNKDYIAVVTEWCGFSRSYIIENTLHTTININYGTVVTFIHKKHKDILDKFLKDRSVGIEYKNNIMTDWKKINENFIETYDEDLGYRLKFENGDTLDEEYINNYESIIEAVNKLGKAWASSLVEQAEAIQAQKRYKAGKEEIEIISAPNSDIKFLKPEFECELFFSNACGDTFGLVDNNIAVFYNKKGICYEICEEENSPSIKYNLTNYKEQKEWYEIESNFPCLIKADNNQISVVYEYQVDNGNLWDCYGDSIISAEQAIRLTDEEIDSLKVQK